MRKRSVQEYNRIIFERRSRRKKLEKNIFPPHLLSSWQIIRQCGFIFFLFFFFLLVHIRYGSLLSFFFLKNFFSERETFHEKLITTHSSPHNHITITSLPVYNIFFPGAWAYHVRKESEVWYKTYTSQDRNITWSSSCHDLSPAPCELPSSWQSESLSWFVIMIIFSLPRTKKITISTIEHETRKKTKMKSWLSCLLLVTSPLFTKYCGASHAKNISQAYHQNLFWRWGYHYFLVRNEKDNNFMQEFPHIFILWILVLVMITLVWMRVPEKNLCLSWWKRLLTLNKISDINERRRRKERVIFFLCARKYIFGVTGKMTSFHLERPSSFHERFPDYKFISLDLHFVPQLHEIFSETWYSYEKSLLPSHPATLFFSLFPLSLFSCLLRS